MIDLNDEIAMVSCLEKVYIGILLEFFITVNEKGFYNVSKMGAIFVFW